MRLRRAIKEPGSLREHKHYPLLFDPQTSGGLLAAVHAKNAEACLKELHELGYPLSLVVGRVTDDTTSVESVTLDGRTFSVAADAEGQRKKGGFENENQANGDGSSRLIKTRVPWSLNGLTLTVDDDAGDQEFLQDLADRTGYFPVGVTYASGEVYQGTGQITDELQVSSQSTTAAVSLGGPGVLTKQ